MLKSVYNLNLCSVCKWGQIKVSIMKWPELNVGYFLWIHLKFNENEHFVVGLKSVIVLYFYQGNGTYLSKEQWDYRAC